MRQKTQKHYPFAIDIHENNTVLCLVQLDRQAKRLFLCLVQTDRQAKRFFKPFAFAKRVLRATARINSSWFYYGVGIFYIFEK
jgi:hypothetical protein